MNFQEHCKHAMALRYTPDVTMGGLAPLQTLVSANGDEGRTHFRTSENPKHQISSAFDQHALQMLNEPMESNQFPVGSDQSKAAALDFEGLKKLSPIEVRENDELAPTLGGGYYDSRNNSIGLDGSQNINTLAHELGHHKLDNTWYGSLVQNMPARAAHMASPLAVAATSPLFKGSLKSRALKSLGMSAALTAPTLLSEAGASYNGYNTLKDNGATPEQLSEYGKHTGNNFLTYLTNPALAAAAGLGGSYLTQKFAKFKLDRRTTFRDLEISIETDQGNYRHWYDKETETEGKTLMKYPYGYIRMTRGMDGEHIDCFVGPNKESDKVFVILTNKAPKFDRVDEEKCMLGFNSAEEAKRVFLEHYSKPKFFNSMKVMSYDAFKEKALGSLTGGPTKLSSAETSADKLIDHSPGPFKDQVPGDYLGYPSTFQGLRSIVGSGEISPTQQIDRMFRTMSPFQSTTDGSFSTTSLEGNSAAQADSPGV